MKPILQDIIIVEGKDDISAVRRAVEADIMITNGLGLSKKRLQEMTMLAKTRGIIVLTDPDYPGGKIRHMIDDKIPNCKHAYLTKEEAMDDKGDIGVEYATPEAILRALEKAHAKTRERTYEYTLTDLVKWGLAGSADCTKRRDFLTKELYLGKTNNKQLLNKLNAYQIPPQAIEAILEKYQG